MTVYVMVTAYFSGIAYNRRRKIYERLREKRWIGLNVPVSWYTSFEDVSIERAISISREEFVECTRPHTIPLTAIHAGPNKPSALP